MSKNNRNNTLQQALELLDDGSEIEKYVKGGSITSETTISEIDSLLGITATFNKKLGNVLQNSPDALKGLEMLKNELEKELNSKNGITISLTPKQPSNLIAQSILKEGYYRTLIGEVDLKLSRFTNLLLETDIASNSAYTHSLYIQYLVTGIALASFLPILTTKAEEITNVNNFESIIFENPTQILGWLYKLGILDLIVNKTDKNYSKAGRIVESFTKISWEMSRKTIQAIYSPREDNKKNHPLNNPDNVIFIEALITKYKLK